jgi:hypothetical protein
MAKSKFKDGDACSICGQKWEKGKRFANHHVDYDSDTTVILCYTCHALLHGSAKIWRHPFMDAGKDLAPYLFAVKVCDMYEDLLPHHYVNKSLIEWPVKESGGGGDV